MEKEENDQRIQLVQQQILKFLRFDFNKRLSVTDKGDDLDAIITGLNTMGEELQSQIIINEKRDHIEMMASIIDSSDDAIIGKDLDGVISFWNKGAENMFGYSSEEVLGKKIPFFIPAELEEEEQMIIGRIRKGERIRHFETVRVTKQGKKIDVSVTISPTKDRQGKITGISKIMRDITNDLLVEKQKAEKEVFEKKINETLELLLKYTLKDFSQKIPVSGKGDEWDAIAVGMNTLGEELEDFIRQLNESNRQLESVNRELEAFSYSISHDLRAPLRAVNGYAEIINEDYGDKLDEEGKRVLGIIKYNASKMGMLIDDLLSFSRLGRQELQKGKVDMNVLTEGVLYELTKSMAHRAEIRTDPLPVVKADYGLMNQVLFNLISNAVKYSSKKENPRVLISAEDQKEEVVFSVSDNGAGFNMDYYDKLFGVFQRLHSQEEFEGTGVGLAIVQRVISKHGGRVWAEGRAGEGATFYFTLPK